MRRFFENKMAYTAVVLLFALAFAWNVSHGATAPLSNPLLVSPVSDVQGSSVPSATEPARIASGPTMPPPPWEEDPDQKVPPRHTGSAM